MNPRKKVPRKKRAKELRTKLLAPEWEGLDPEYRVFFGSLEEDNPELATGVWTPDLRKVARAFASEKIELLRQFLRFPYSALSEIPGGDQHVVTTPRGLTAQLPDWAWLIVADELQSTLRAGFYLAVKKYADELHRFSEMHELAEKRLKAAHEGGKTQHKKAAPQHKRIRAKFRQLRKTSPKKTVRWRRLAREFRKSERQIARIVAGID